MLGIEPRSKRSWDILWWRLATTLRATITPHHLGCLIHGGNEVIWIVICRKWAGETALTLWNGTRGFERWVPHFRTQGGHENALHSHWGSDWLPSPSRGWDATMIRDKMASQVSRLTRWHGAFANVALHDRTRLPSPHKPTYAPMSSTVNPTTERF